MRKRAFTLIELLVVIAIIAVLAAILFPVFAQAKLAAKGAASVANVRQVGMANLMYANDADDVSLINGTASSDAPYTIQDTPTNPWGLLLMPYLKSPRLLQDPLTQAESETLGLSGDLAFTYLTQFGYAFTVHSPAVKGESESYTYAPLARTALARPAETVLFTAKKRRNGHPDWRWTNSTIWGANIVNPPLCHGETMTDAIPASVCGNLTYWGSDAPAYEGQSFEEGGYTGGVAFRRSGRSSVVWADGHASSVLPAALAAGTNWTRTTPSASVVTTDKDRYVWDAE